MSPRLRHRPPVPPGLPALRRRTAHLLALQGPRFRALVRAVPMLLCTRLRRPSLEIDPPGVVRPPRRRRWARLCEALDLPAPTGWFPVRPLVQCVLLTPSATGWELLVVPLEGLGRAELSRVVARVEAIAHVASRHAPGLEVRMASTAELTPALFAWAGVVAGELPALAPHGSFDWLEAFSRAPSDLLRCLCLLVGREAPAPLQLLVAGAPAALTAFVAHWSNTPLARDLSALATSRLSAAELSGLITKLRAGCRAALRALPAVERRFALRSLRGPLFGRRIPRPLLPHLDRLLAQASPLELQRGATWELELDGLVIARAPTLDQLRAFALVESPRLAHPAPPWARVVALGRAAAPHALVQIEPGFLRHLAIVVPPRGRPRARRLDASELLRFVVMRQRAGVPIELLTTAGADPTLVARAHQLMRLRMRRDEEVGIQLGARALILGAGPSRTPTVERAFVRPRRLTWLPEQAEALRALRRPAPHGLPSINVVALPEGDRDVALFALDESGELFRERVPRHDLALTLSDYRELLRNGAPPVLVSASVHPLLTSLSGRLDERLSPVRLELELGPHGERVCLEGEWFGAGCELSWAALGEAVLSHWAPGASAPLSIQRARITRHASPLSVLAARSRVLRRVSAQLRRIASTLRAA